VRVLRRPPDRISRDTELAFVDHLDELRTRLLIILGCLVAAFAVVYPFHATLIRLLNQPLPAGHRHPVTFGVAEPFMLSVKVTLAAALGLTLPIALWQAWAFFAPALSDNTERQIAALVAGSTILLALGVTFGYVLALPAALHFLTNFDQSLYDVQVRAGPYYSFALMVLAAVGVVFELPVFVVGLNRLGIVGSEWLRHNRRVGYFIVAVIAVALPGVDPVTTIIEAIPLFALYEASIWLVVLDERRRRNASTGREASSATQ
jgi:sec-independent protein translocase protein TatC